jgi:hypothetical protein
LKSASKRVILDRSELPDASHESLAATYKEVTGNSLPDVYPEAVWVTVSMAMLSREYRKDNRHHGTQISQAPVTPTRMEISMTEKPKKEPKAKAAPKGKTPIGAVKAANSGTSKVRETSQRGVVLKYVQSKDGAVSIDEVTAAVGFEARGHILKLIEVKHLEIAE